MIFLVAALGFSLADVVKKWYLGLSAAGEAQHIYSQIKKKKAQLSDLEILIEFKMQVVRAELLSLKDPYKKKKFDELIANLPFDFGSQSDPEMRASRTAGEVTLEELESEIYSYIKTKYKLKRKCKRLRGLLAKIRQQGGRGALETALRKLGFAFLVSMSGVVVLLIVLNGFNIPRDFLQHWLKQLSPVAFAVVFAVYSLFVGHLVVNGVLKSRFQNFKGMSSGGNTDTQSLVYFSRSVHQQHRSDGHSLLLHHLPGPPRRKY